MCACVACVCKWIRNQDIRYNWNKQKGLLKILPRQARTQLKRDIFRHLKKIIQVLLKYLKPAPSHILARYRPKSGTLFPSRINHIDIYKPVVFWREVNDPWEKKKEESRIHFFFIWDLRKKAQIFTISLISNPGTKTSANSRDCVIPSLYLFLNPSILRNFSFHRSDCVLAMVHSIFSSREKKRWKKCFFSLTKKYSSRHTSESTSFEY